MNEGCITPVRATKNSAGYDFFTPVDIIIPAHGTSKTVDLGVAVALDPDKVLLCHVRSSLGFKHDCGLVNFTGIIDADFYPNTIKVKFRNYSDNDVIIKAGEKCMQGIIMQYFTVDDEDEVSTERSGGIGSTGK